MFNEPSLVKKFGLKKIIEYFTEDKFVDPADQEKSKKLTRTSKGLTSISDEFATLSDGLISTTQDPFESNLNQGMDTHQSTKTYH